MKKQRLNSQELGILAMALLKNLFPKPEKGKVLYEDHDDGSCTLYLDFDYYDELLLSMKLAHSQGKFMNSNAGKEWIDLMNKIEASVDILNVDKRSLKLYGLTK